MYLKFRDRQSYEFALVSVAARSSRATAPSPTSGWRSAAWPPSRGGPAAPRRRCSARRRRGRFAARRSTPNSPPRSPRAHNAFKVELAERAIVRGLPQRPRCGMTTAIGPPVDRVDGPQKVTGAARYTAEIALPRLALRGRRRRELRERAGHGDRRRRRLAADGVLAVLTHENPPGSPASRACCRPWSASRHRARASSRCRTISCTTTASRWRSSSPTATSGRSTPPRWSTSSTSASRSITTIDAGPGRGLRGETPVRRPDAGAQRARRRRRGAGRRRRRRRRHYHMAANHHNPLEAPTTTAAWDGDR